MDARYAGAGSPRLVERTQVTRHSRPSLVRRVAHVPSTFAAALVLAALLVCLPLALAARAEGFVYWTKLEGPFSNGLPIKPLAGIDRANLDGSGVDESFITGVDGLRSVAVDGGHVYWGTFPLHGDATIGRANLDGSEVDPNFIGGFNLPQAIAVDGGHVYWTWGALDGRIGRANVDGTEVDPNFITGASNPWGIAVDGGHVYWGNVATGDSTIGRANLDGSGVDQSFITAARGFSLIKGLAVDGAHVYWTSGDLAGGIGRANLDGTEVDPSFITGACLPSGVALDGGHIYWANDYGDGMIGRANLDGSGVNQSFITGAGAGLYGLAVDALSSPGPDSTPPPASSPDCLGLGGLERNANRGTAKLIIKVPGAGVLQLSKTKRVRNDSEQAATAGKARLRVRPRAKAKAKLAATGKVKIRLPVTYTPSTGPPITSSKEVKLKQR